MLRQLFRGLADILYPKICVSCKNKLTAPAVDDLVCADCWGKIKKNVPPFCHSCGRHLGPKNINRKICPQCVKNPLCFDRAFSPCVYDGPVKELIHQFKYGGKDYLGRPLSRLLIEFIRDYNLSIEYLDYIVAVPLHKTRLREREFNQAQVLASSIAREFDKKLLTDTLQRSRNTKTQTELQTRERFSNMRGSFSVSDPHAVKGKNLLLVDDVLTTGATASEAALALKNAGANIVFALTLAN